MRIPVLLGFLLLSLTGFTQNQSCEAYGYYDFSEYNSDKHLGFNVGLKYYGSTYVSTGISFIHEKYRQGGGCMWSNSYVCKGIYLEFADDINSKTKSLHAGVWAGSVLTLGLEANSVFSDHKFNLGIQPLAGISYRIVQVLAGYNIQPITSDVNPPNQWTFLIRAHIPVFIIEPGRRKKYDLE